MKHCVTLLTRFLLWKRWFPEEKWWLLWAQSCCIHSVSQSSFQPQSLHFHLFPKSHRELLFLCSLISIHVASFQGRKTWVPFLLWEDFDRFVTTDSQEYPICCAVSCRSWAGGLCWGAEGIEAISEPSFSFSCPWLLQDTEPSACCACWL